MTNLLQGADGWLRTALSTRCDQRQQDWTDTQVAALEAGGIADDRFAQLLSLASRFAPKVALEPTHEQCTGAATLLGGWNPERWSTLEAVRVRLILARARADAETLPAAIAEAFRYADEGELCALYRSIQFLPGPERFAWQAAEGCRSNMMSVFEANGCDTAYPVAHMDDVAWRQLCMKSIFVNAPLWRVHGLDGRVDADLSRMALDLFEERRSAGRAINPELWMCLGFEPTERALAAIEAELDGHDELSRKGAILALGRLGQTERLNEIERDGGTVFGPTAQWALMGRHDQSAFAAVSIPEGATPSTRSAPAT